MTIIDTFNLDERDTAEHYAAETGGYASRARTCLVVRHDHADGLRVTRWMGREMPLGTVLVRASAIERRDMLVTDRFAIGYVEDVEIEGDGEVAVSFKDAPFPFVYAADAYVPLTSRVMLGGVRIDADRALPAYEPTTEPTSPDQA